MLPGGHHWPGLGAHGPAHDGNAYATPGTPKLPAAHVTASVSLASPDGHQVPGRCAHGTGEAMVGQADPAGHTTPVGATDPAGQ